MSRDRVGQRWAELVHFTCIGCARRAGLSSLHTVGLAGWLAGRLELNRDCWSSTGMLRMHELSRNGSYLRWAFSFENK
jgi:hypothetical protein